jgi:hypothetical protein
MKAINEVSTRKVYDTTLPDNKCCDDCFHFLRCTGIGCTWTMRKECDFYPSRFEERTVK